MSSGLIVALASDNERKRRHHLCQILVSLRYGHNKRSLGTISMRPHAFIVFLKIFFPPALEKQKEILTGTLLIQIT